MQPIFELCRRFLSTKRGHRPWLIRPHLEALEPRALLSTYHVSLTDPSANFHSISDVNAKAYSASPFRPGDRILFQGGQTFQGTLSLDASYQPGNLTFSSYGSGRATIDGGNTHALWDRDLGGLSITNLNFIESQGSVDNWRNGLWFHSDLTNGQVSGVTIDDVDVSGFSGTGILFDTPNSAPNAGCGFSNVRITHTNVYDNRTMGIQVAGYTDYNLPSPTPYSNTNFYLGHDHVYNNSGLGNPAVNYLNGFGIFLWDINGATVERCVIDDNGSQGMTTWPNGSQNGPVGLMASQANNVTFQYNEAYHNLTANNFDGEGIDLDGGVTNSVMQYNYTHDNFGAGLLSWQYAGANPKHGNTIRYNFSQNDGWGVVSFWSGLTVGNDAGASYEDGLNVYNNTIFQSSHGGGFAADLSGLTNSRFLDNILITTDGRQLYRNAGATFQGNDFWTMDNPTNPLNTVNSQLRLEQAPEQVAKTLDDADLIPTLAAPRLKWTSPVIHQGLNLQQAFGINSGPNDLEGNSTSADGVNDVGCYELPHLVQSVQPGSLRNPADFTGYVGMQFTTGKKPVHVTELGRWVVSGNSQYHTLGLINPSSFAWVPGGSVALNLAGKAAGAFAYAALAAPVMLAANTSYFLVSSETYGGDVWYDGNTTVTATPLARSFDKLVSWSSAGGWNITAAPNLCFGPLDLIDPPGLADETVSPALPTLMQGAMVAPPPATGGIVATRGGEVAFADAVPLTPAMPESVRVCGPVSSLAPTSAGPLWRRLADEAQASLRVAVPHSGMSHDMTIDGHGEDTTSQGQGTDGSPGCGSGEAAYPEMDTRLNLLGNTASV
jgi:hypothetical protein